MSKFNPQSGFSHGMLATDLDGTLIPMDGYPDNIRSLEVIKSGISDTDTGLIYVTGRHLESVRSAVEEFQLPIPDWMICDVGTSIYRVADGTESLFAPYEEHLSSLVGGRHRGEVEGLLNGIGVVQLQSSERQQRFKISYECDVADLSAAVKQMNDCLSENNFPYAVMESIDPFEGCGLLDVLPVGVSKAYAVTWLAGHADFSPDDVVFAGDSGNDKAALISGFRAIVVGNASEELAAEVRIALDKKGWIDRYFRASSTATSGVLEGCRHFGLFS